MSKQQELELTRIRKEDRPRLEPRVSLEDPEKSDHGAQLVTDHERFDSRLIFDANLRPFKAIKLKFIRQFKKAFYHPAYWRLV